MQIQPILAALRRHRLATALIALEIALACAVLCNACFLIANRLALMQVHSGVDETSLATLHLTGYEPEQAVDLNARVQAGLGRIAGMQSVSVINAVPFGQHAGTAGIMLDPAGKHFGGVVDFYVGGPGSFKALGLQLVAGSAPQAGDYQPMNDFVPDDATVWVTRALAGHLWPDADPLGKEFWMGKSHFRVGGVLAHLVRPSGGEGGSETVEWSVFVPARPGASLAGTYLLRAAPQDLPRVLRDARAAMVKIAPDAVVDTLASQTISDLREGYFREDRAMAGMLLGVIAALLLVTALGIVGLASFWVAQRRKQIGIRRAIGATRADILHYFQTENFLIVSGGIVLGMALAYALNLMLMTRYELPRLPLFYLPIGALVLWALGQLSVLGPALRAAAVPPVVATRSA
ncbi:FtsX-like permease family protein [Rhodanobacter sp. FDAARGOS 1247]|uniref:ABC transporter permease n=1 Tax=Rhodanobacter sp. FDAARGOS 1247 TaxID=2778082 RepID=UPI00194EB0C9|nr:FtsX-like permease family protein [Rhodanobacter sp. FDAARGOS 1247]QRP64629.1 FtsX-like permease family protein [Rhodanobacter sp. FDAARGOS 1247]